MSSLCHQISIWNIHILYLKCKQRQEQSCYATAKLINDEFILTQPHNHGSDERLKIIYRFTNALYEAVTSSIRSHRLIYDEVCILDPEGAAHVPFVKAQQSRYKWRLTNSPAMTQSWLHYTELLQMEKWQCFTIYNGGQLNVTAVQGMDGSISIVYGDVDFIRSVNSVHISVDTTFKVCPRKPKVLQLLTVMLRIDDCMLPIAWALMERKSTEAYAVVINHFATVLAPHLRPSSFMLDFERALASALQRTYPEATEEHCFFHYCQALMRRAKKLKLLPRIQGCFNRAVVFRKVMALALLPANDIPAAFQWITANVTPEIAEDYQTFFEYYERYWLRNVGPQTFSVFGVQHKTNNDVEAYHRVLGVRMGAHPSVWQFTEHLRNLQAVIRSSAASLDFGFPITQSPERRQKAQPTIQRIWQLYEERAINIPSFLLCASHCLKIFNREFLLAEDEIENFLNARVQDINEHYAQNRPARQVEDLNEIDILPQGIANEDHEFILRPGIVFPLCSLCEDTSMDTIALPCGHWFACSVCTRQMIQLSVLESADIRCSICDIPFDDLCVICRVNPIRSICVPCMHVAFCEECGKRCEGIAAETGERLRCPLCNTNARGFEIAFFPGRR